MEIQSLTFLEIFILLYNKNGRKAKKKLKYSKYGIIF